jgi:hypothetical protein
MMTDNDFPIRLAGQRFGLDSQRLARITPSEVTSRLRYQQTFPPFLICVSPAHRFKSIPLRCPT